jgi:hypothetical protein
MKKRTLYALAVAALLTYRRSRRRGTRYGRRF